MSAEGSEQTNKAPTTKPDYDSNFTDAVIAATGPNANPRLVQIMPSLIRHLHDFAREVDLTVAEWAAGVDLVRVSLSRYCKEQKHAMGQF
jgi:catechol 1,2-dioxygenase